jgi:hypothetical protein
MIVYFVVVIEFDNPFKFLIAAENKISNFMKLYLKGNCT